MAKKAQKVRKGKRSELLIVNPDAAGIDVASNEYQVCVPEDRDTDFNRRFDAFTCDLLAIVGWLKQCRVKTVAMEATGVYWVQLYTVLEAHGFDVVICNAKHIKNLGEKKTDYVDAGWIQMLHTYGLLTESFIPEGKIREVKNLCRHRESLIERCNQSLLRIHKSLDMMNIKIHKVLSDIKGESGMSVLKAIVAGERDPMKLSALVNHRVKATREEIRKSLDGYWNESQVFILKQNLDGYHYAQQQVKELDVVIEDHLKAYTQLIKKNTTEANPRKLIRSEKVKDANNAFHFDAEKYCFEIFGVNITRIPGISGTTAMKLLAELGPGFVGKFPTDGKFSSWANLAPNNKKSGGKLLSSKVPKRKSPVGQHLRVAANTLKNNKGHLGDFFRAKKARSGYNQAIVAVAHKLSRIIYKMVKDQVEYDMTIENEKNIITLQKRLIHLKRKAESIEMQLQKCA